MCGEQALTLKPGYPEAVEYRGEAFLGLNRTRMPSRPTSIYRAAFVESFPAAPPAAGERADLLAFLDALTD